MNLLLLKFPMRNIGGRVRLLRTELRMTLPELAELSGLSKGLLSKLENDEDPNPSLTTLHKVAEPLKVTLSELLETEHAQVRRLIPEEQPEWQKELIAYLNDQGKKPDTDILNALYFLRNRKAGKAESLEHWKFLYQSIENSFKK